MSDLANRIFNATKNEADKQRAWNSFFSFENKQTPESVKEDIERGYKWLGLMRDHAIMRD